MEVRGGWASAALSNSPAVRQAEVAVVAHVHYPEIWPDIQDRLARVPMAFDLFVTVTRGAAEDVIPGIRRRFPGAVIELVANRGRDWGPFVGVLNAGHLRGYRAIAKVHTKKSEHRLDGDGWRLDLLDGIFESPASVRRIVDLLDEDRTVGLVVPSGHVSGPEHWGSDQSLIEALAARAPMAFDPDALAFPAGSMFWCRPWLLEALRVFKIEAEDFDVEAGQYDGTTAHALERLVGVVAVAGGMDVVEAADVPKRLREARRSPAVKPIVAAFYLPQYHQDAANDDFWGAGFTDWRKVRAAAPLFPGHRQPLELPEGVGYYDLADPDALRRQAIQAAQSGVDVMVLHHYWFDGRRVLTKPLENLLADATIDMTFALCWANEPWTRRWDGLEQDVLISQSFSPGWERAFFEDIHPALVDPRYLRVDGRPVLIVYRLDLLPNVPGVVARWRELAKDAGLPGLFVLGVHPSRDFGGVDDAGIRAIDGVITFPPGSGVNLVSLMSHLPRPHADIRGDVLSYDAAADSRPLVVPGASRVFPGVFPGWDNTARRGQDAYVFHGSNPITFRRWIQRASEQAARLDAPMLFVNAWNEWAEGAAIEGYELPDVWARRRA